VNAHGDNFQTVTQPQAQFGFALEHPDWSPDGERITFTGTEGGVFTIRSDGTNLRNLNVNKAFAIFASYSPDGRKMVVLGQDGLSTMNVDGSGLVKIAGAPPGVTNSDWAVVR